MSDRQNESWNDLDAFLDHSSAGTGALPLPPPNAQLLAAVRDSAAVKPRRPMRRAALVLFFGLAQVAVILLALGLRRDLEELPRLWTIAYVGAWLLGFAILAWGAQVPARGQVMSRSAVFGPLGFGFAVAFVVGGLVFAEHVPGLSTMYEPTLDNVIKHAPYCFKLGLATSVLPLLGASLLLRGAAPRGQRLLGAAIGASAGSLGGLVLHLRCPIAEATHLGLVHGGVVLISALVGALVVPFLTRPR